MKNRIRIEVHPIFPIQIIYDYLSHFSDHNPKLKTKAQTDILHIIETFWLFLWIHESDKRTSEIDLLIHKVQAEKRKAESILGIISSTGINETTKFQSNVVESKKYITLIGDNDKYQFIEELKSQKLTPAMLEEAIVILIGIEASSFLFDQKIHDLAKYQNNLRTIHDLAQSMTDNLYQIKPQQALNPSINDPTQDFYIEKPRSIKIESVPSPDDDESDALESIFNI